MEGGAGEGKACLIEDDMTRDDDASCGEVETPIALMRGGVAEKNASLCLAVAKRLG